MNAREGFMAIVGGWTLISGMDDLTDRIERAAEWTAENGPLCPDEEATMVAMIEAQIARHGQKAIDRRLVAIIKDILAERECQRAYNCELAREEEQLAEGLVLR